MTSIEFLKVALIKFIAISMISAKLAAPGLLKRTAYQEKITMASIVNGLVQLYFTC